VERNKQGVALFPQKIVKKREDGVLEMSCKDFSALLEIKSVEFRVEN
jgi:hypothetical protein